MPKSSKFMDTHPPMHYCTTCAAKFTSKSGLSGHRKSKTHILSAQKQMNMKGKTSMVEKTEEMKADKDMSLQEEKVSRLRAKALERALGIPEKVSFSSPFVNGLFRCSEKGCNTEIGRPSMLEVSTSQVEVQMAPCKECIMKKLKAEAAAVHNSKQLLGKATTDLAQHK